MDGWGGVSVMAASDALRFPLEAGLLNGEPETVPPAGSGAATRGARLEGRCSA